MKIARYITDHLKFKNANPCKSLIIDKYIVFVRYHDSYC